MYNIDFLGNCKKRRKNKKAANLSLNSLATFIWNLHYKWIFLF